MTDKKWRLGQTSEKFEVRGRGAGTIAHTNGDHGGTSYGLSQFSVNTGSVQEYLRHSAYGDQFRGLTPDTPAFDAKWKEVAKQFPGFGEDQRNYTKAKYYDVQSAQLKARGLDLSDRGPAVQDAIWSTAVQFGGRTRLIEKSLHESYGRPTELSRLSDSDIVAAVQDYKLKHNQELFKSSRKHWRSLEDRAVDEKADLLKIAGEHSIAHSSPHTSSDARLSDASHPGNALFSQAQALMQKIDAQHNRASDQRTEQAAGAIAVAAYRKGMTEIDRLELVEGGARIVVVQGTPGSVLSRVAVLDTAQALDTPVAQSSKEFIGAMERQHSRESELQAQQNKHAAEQRPQHQ